MKYSLIISIIFVGLCGGPLFGRLSESELIQRKKESVNDWTAVLSALRKAGYSENNRLYRRVETAKKRAETRLKNLQGGSVSEKTQEIQQQGRSILEQLGILGPEKQEPAVKQKQAVKQEPVVTKPAKKKVTSKPTTKKKSATKEHKKPASTKIAKQKESAN